MFLLVGTLLILLVLQGLGYVRSARQVCKAWRQIRRRERRNREARIADAKQRGYQYDEQWYANFFRRD